jgi:hypothetical protein
MPVMFDRVEGSVAPETENAATSEPQPSPQPPQRPSGNHLVSSEAVGASARSPTSRLILPISWCVVGKMPTPHEHPSQPSALCFFGNHHVGNSTQQSIGLQCPSHRAD